MMEINMWNDDLLFSGDWDLGPPFHQEDGLFGDLKFNSLSESADVLNFETQNAVESPSNESLTDEGGLDSEWMESTDLCSYFDTVGSSGPVLLSQDPSPLPQELNVIEPEQQIVVDSVNYDAGGLQDLKHAGSNVILTTKTPFCIDESYDALVSPPISPGQVSQAVIYEHNSTGDIKSVELSDTHSSSFAAETHSLLTSPDVFAELDFFNVEQVDDESFIRFGGAACDLINSPLSADDVDSTLSSSKPASPEPLALDQSSISIIEASPELFKVIASSSPKLSARASPYPTSRPAKKQAKPISKRPPAQPVPEHVISEQVNKKVRKKLQNKNAAIRYRQKKKEEAKDIKSEEQELEEYNTSLKTKVEDIEREIRYMKNLMEDVLKAKGLM